MYESVLKNARNRFESTKRFPYTVKCGNAQVTIYRVKHAKMKSGFIYSVAWYDAEGVRRQKQFAKIAKAEQEAKLKAEQLQAGEAELADAKLADIRELKAARKLAGEGGLIPALEEWKRGRELCQGPIEAACQAWAIVN